MKVCTKCGIEKDESEFNKNSKQKDGLHPRCKECRRKESAEYYLNNTEKVKLNSKIQSKKEDPEKRRIRTKKWHEKNKEYHNQLNTLNQKRNRDAVNQRVRVWRKQMYQNNSSYNIKAKTRAMFLLSIKRYGAEKRKPFFEYTGVAYADYIAYLENNYPLEFAEITEKGKYHIDHIIPCAVYDFNNPDEIKLCWQPENLRIISAKENQEKNDKLDYDLIEKHNIWHLLPDRLKQKSA